MSGAGQYIEQLKAEIQALCERRGILTPSIYDTAQVLRHAPPEEPKHQEAVVEWLLAQQREDGGFGETGGDDLPRHVPTLAAILALHEYNTDEKNKKNERIPGAVKSGLDFVKRTAGIWENGGQVPNDIPVATELIIPVLMDEVKLANIDDTSGLPYLPFKALRALGDKRRKLIAKVNPPAGTAPVHTWEAWGHTWESGPGTMMLDGSGGVGHSPAATAVWLHMRRKFSLNESADEQAKKFLRDCEAATGLGVPGLYPTVWPIDRFEQSWALYAIMCVLNPHDYPALYEEAAPQFETLRAAVKPKGIGMSDDFVADGDLTTTTLAVLSEAGLEVDASIMDRFMGDEHFITYDNELQVSLTTTAHGVLAFAQVGRNASPLVRQLAKEQDSDGLWKRDKWHKSWLYTTAQVMIALARAVAAQTKGKQVLDPQALEQTKEALDKAVQGLLARQRTEKNEKGGWGFSPKPSLAETAYAVHALFSLKGSPLYTPAVEQALRQAADFMGSQEQALQSLITAKRTPDNHIETYWIGKELFCPYRVDGAFVLTALVALESEVKAKDKTGSGAAA